MNNAKQILKSKLSEKNYEKLSALENSKLHKFIADAIELTNPDSVFVCGDSPEDTQYIRDMALKTGEEKDLATKGHTVHFDGYHDQARDKSQTKYLLAEGSQLGESLKSTERRAGIEEVRGYLKDSMVGKQMLVCFFCLGPLDSDFSICSVQITDSPYVAHSETILYRSGYEQFRKIGNSESFFRFLHTEGALENNVSKNIDKRRIYIDLQEDIVYSTNTQYAGNTVGLKKLALRLAIQKAAREGWLAEHMFVMGAHGPNNRVTYFTGAFPSACGKTSTAMLPGQTIIGDDIAYLRSKNGKAFCANVEKGVFGIIRDVNSDDDPVIYDALTRECEVIFSNVLVKDGKPYWLGMGKELPKEGFNHSGKWYEGKKDSEGKKITASHKNARYCLNISELSNRDSRADDPEGVPLGGVVYGGRDSDTWVPVEQAFNWREGIIAKGASIESETTAATLGQEGVRKFNIMSNMDFLSIPLGKYIQTNIDFGEKLETAPSIFSVNYFLKDENGEFLNGIMDKVVWIMWAERRVNNDVKARRTPTGYIPEYDDLAKLFKEHRNKDYTKENYEKEFTVRIPENLEKIDRIEKIYREKVDDTPQAVFDTFEKIRERYHQLKEQKGDYVSPFELPEE